MNDTKINKRKVVLIGDSNVGKSSLLSRLKFNTFSLKMDSTIGCEFLVHHVNIRVPFVEHVNEKESGGRITNGDIESDGNVKLLIWDTAGQEMFRCFTPNFLRGADACVICYDLRKAHSLASVDGWAKLVRKTCSEDVIIALVGTKSDTVDDDEMKIAEAAITQAANDINASVITTTSAKTGKGVSRLFYDVATEIASRGNGSLRIDDSVVQFSEFVPGASASACTC